MFRCTVILFLALGLAPAASITGLTLIDAASDQPVAAHDPLVDGAVIDLAVVGTALNIRANVSGTPTKVNFALSGTESHTQSEGTAPYALKGDSSGDYTSWTPAIGSYVLQVDADGGAALSVAFSVVSGGGGGGGEAGSDGDGSVVISGERKRWHKVTLTMDGPWSSETATPNPFLDRRMTVTFSHAASGLSYTVPGYFAADGAAADSGAGAGTAWRAHLSPDHTGTWTWAVDFRTGTDCAVNGGGSTLAPYHGKTGSLTVGETDKTGRDLRGRGRLQYVGGHYPRFAGDGSYLLKQGPDAPENLLAYADFDGPFKTDGHQDDLIKTWSAHLGDWQSGDPTWQGGKGKALIGAINYLASEGMNAFSFLTMNINGDDRNVFPYLDYGERLRMDVSRLAQWEVVFAHATRKGMFLHFKTQETENETLLDGGALGRQRTLYYRELIARFAHHLALNWNLGEENNDQSDAQRKAMAQYFHDHDPYRHLVVIHTYPGGDDSIYGPLLGDASKLTGASLQLSNSNFSDVHNRVLEWVGKSAAAGKPWAVAVDEPGDAQHALRPDDDAGTSHVDGRKNALWGTLLGGGWGNEWYFGYGHAHSDLTCQDFRSRDAWWDGCRHALRFFDDHAIPFWRMVNDNGRSSASSDYCFFEAGETYLVYLKNGGTTTLDLGGVSGTFSVHWYDPRNGGALATGSVITVSGGGSVGLGSAPDNASEDWLILVQHSGGSPGNTVPVIGSGPTANPAPVTGTTTQLSVVASDADGDSLGYAWTVIAKPSGAATPSVGSGATTTATFSKAGSYTFRVTVSDGQASVSGEVSVTVQQQAQSIDLQAVP